MSNMNFKGREVYVANRKQKYMSMRKKPLKKKEKKRTAIKMKRSSLSF
jgi:hypothetical protein